MFSSCTDPMQNVVQVLEKQYLEEKRTALEEQRMMYERELESLRQQLSPEKTAQQHHSSSERLAFPVAAAHGKLRLWTEERSVRLSKGLGTESSVCLVWIWSPGVLPGAELVHRGSPVSNQNLVLKSSSVIIQSYDTHSYSTGKRRFFSVGFL